MHLGMRVLKSGAARAGFAIRVTVDSGPPTSGVLPAQSLSGTRFNFHFLVDFGSPHAECDVADVPDAETEESWLTQMRIHCNAELTLVLVLLLLVEYGLYLRPDGRRADLRIIVCDQPSKNLIPGLFGRHADPAPEFPPVGNDNCVFAKIDAFLWYFELLPEVVDVVMRDVLEVTTVTGVHAKQIDMVVPVRAGNNWSGKVVLGYCYFANFSGFLVLKSQRKDGTIKRIYDGALVLVASTILTFDFLEVAERVEK